jgi:hypothetical protein
MKRSAANETVGCEWNGWLPTNNATAALYKLPTTRKALLTTGETLSTTRDALSTTQETLPTT